MNVILNRFNSVFYEAFREACVDEDIKIAAWLRDFPELVNFNKLQDTLSVSKGIYFNPELWYLQENDLRWYETFKGLFCNVLSRFCLNPSCFSVEEMSWHYLRLVNYWENFISKNNVDAVLSSDPPHDPSSLALYLVCKKNKLPILFIDGGIVAEKFFFLGTTFSDRTLLTRGNLVQRADVSIEISQYINRVKEKKYNPGAFYQKAWSEKSKIFDFKDIAALFPYSISGLFRGKLYNKPSSGSINWLKINRSNWANSSSSTKSRFEWFKIKLDQNYKKNRQKTKYKSLCTPIEKVNNFIYFPAHLEPEASTLPLTLYNRHFFPFLKAICQNLPPGYCLLYKENPMQFFWDQCGGDYRSEYFYDEILSIGNIKFVDFNISTTQLIDKSIGVATIVGTVANEAVFRGKYCITNWTNYYDFLDGVKRVKCNNDIKDAIALMISGKKPLPKVEQYYLCENYFECEQFGTFTRRDYSRASKALLSCLKNYGKYPATKFEV